MNVKLKKVVSAYDTLGKAKVSTLDEKDVIKVVKMRKAMRPFIEEYESFEKDVEEKFKPEDFDKQNEIYFELQKKARGTGKHKPSEEEWNAVDALNEYYGKIERAKAEEKEKEIEINLEPLSEDVVTKLLIENGWELSKLEEIDICL